MDSNYFPKKKCLIRKTGPKVRETVQIDNFSVSSSDSANSLDSSDETNFIFELGKTNCIEYGNEDILCCSNTKFSLKDTGIKNCYPALTRNFKLKCQQHCIDYSKIDLERKFKKNTTETVNSIAFLRESMASKATTLGELDKDYSFFLKNSLVELVILSSSNMKKQCAYAEKYKTLSILNEKPFKAVKALIYVSDPKKDFFLLVDYGENNVFWLSQSYFLQEDSLFYLSKVVPVPSRHMINALNCFVEAHEKGKLSAEFTRTIDSRCDRLLDYLGMNFEDFVFTGKFVLSTKNKYNKSIVCARFRRKGSKNEFYYFPTEWVPNFAVSPENFPSEEDKMEQTDLSWLRLNFLAMARETGKTLEQVEGKYYSVRYDNELKYALKWYCGSVSSHCAKMIKSSKSYLAQLQVLKEFNLFKRRILVEVDFGTALSVCQNGILIMDLDRKIRAVCVKAESQIGFKSIDTNAKLSWAIVYG